MMAWGRKLALRKASRARIDRGPPFSAIKASTALVVASTDTADTCNADAHRSTANRLFGLLIWPTRPAPLRRVIAQAETQGFLRRPECLAAGADQAGKEVVGVHAATSSNPVGIGAGGGLEDNPQHT